VTVRALHLSFVTLVLAIASPAGAQDITVAPLGPRDSILVRAQRLANDGNAAAGRALLDSVLSAAKDGSTEYVDALFGRAMLAGSADEARNNYLRIAVNYSDSPRAEDALLRLAQMELSRGDRDAAKRYLERLALEHPDGASRAQGAYWLGRVLIDDGAILPACASLAEAKTRVAPSDIELANQITYYARPCAAAVRAAQYTADSIRADSIDKAVQAARADSVARADSITKAKAAAKKKKKAVANAGSRETAAAPAKGTGWTVQVAAYDAQVDAERLAKRLTDRGYDARVTNEKPFRVRIGKYARHEDAADMVEKLKDAKITAIVVEAEKP
jgi:cell division septation protein DedD